MEFKKQNKRVKEKKRERERKTNQETLNYREQTDGYRKVGGWGEWVKYVHI